MWGESIFNRSLIDRIDLHVFESHINTHKHIEFEMSTSHVETIHHHIYIYTNYSRRDGSEKEF